MKFRYTVSKLVWNERAGMDVAAVYAHCRTRADADYLAGKSGTVRDELADGIASVATMLEAVKRATGDVRNTLRMVARDVRELASIEPADVNDDADFRPTVDVDVR